MSLSAASSAGTAGERCVIERDVIERDVVILGGGLTGLAAAAELGERAVVLERLERPGGLVRTECFDGYWFDRVIHLLYFSDPRTEARISGLLGDQLAECPPEAWVETAAGTVRYPFQMHLGGLDSETAVRCLRDLAEVTFGSSGDHRAGADPPADFEQMLLRTFGRAMCETFLFPYNRKMWQRPLAELAPSGFQWNITHPDFEAVLRGALARDSDFRAYNSRGWYPRPPAGAPVRGMEVLSRALAGQAADLRLRHTVEHIDPGSRTVTARGPEGPVSFRWRRACLSTLPLPTALEISHGAPEALHDDCRRQLQHNRVRSAALSIEGPRPKARGPGGCGHWRYYADEDLTFTRLVYMHAFDPEMAPPEGWGLLAEVTERAEEPAGDPEAMLDRVVADVQKAGALPAGCRVIGRRLLEIDPAYVVFSPTNAAVVERARAWLEAGGITPLGRYGRWEYSSMSQVMRDGFAWAEALSGRS